MTPETLMHARALRARLQGDLVLPGDENWDEARQAWNLAVDQRPAAVALPETADDVVAIVDFAREHGYRVAPQGTGHNAGPLGWLDETILIKTERMRRVEIDAESRRARVEAGVLWIEATEAAAEHGLAALAGSSPDVGVVGYSLGGGVSWLARKHGLAANSVTAVELVTSDGRLVRVDADHEPDLFWGLRGGGGNFGVVTSIDFRLYPITEVYAGWLIWPIERADEVLTAWQKWTETVPDEITSVGRLLNIPPLPDVPEPLRGRSVVVVEAIYIGDEAEGAELIAPLRALEPEIDTFATIPASALSKLHMDPEQPEPGIGDGMMLDDLTPDAVSAITGIVGPDSPLLSVEVRHLGGELGRHAPGNGVLASLDAAYLMFAVGIPMSPELAEGIERDIALLQRALARWDAGRMYLNFAEQPRSGRALFGEDGYARLRRLKTEIDPENVFHANHQVEPADQGLRRATSRRVVDSQRRAA
jgi:UDP-N-acetylenolpyruvoylglucosamine reductase